MRPTWQAGGSGVGVNWSSTFGHNQPYFLPFVEIRPFEPREFPLSDEKYTTMLNDDQTQVWM